MFVLLHLIVQYILSMTMCHFLLTFPLTEKSPKMAVNWTQVCMRLTKKMSGKMMVILKITLKKRLAESELEANS